MCVADFVPDVTHQETPESRQVAGFFSGEKALSMFIHCSVLSYAVLWMRPVITAQISMDFFIFLCCPVLQ